MVASQPHRVGLIGVGPGGDLHAGALRLIADQSGPDAAPAEVVATASSRGAGSPHWPDARKLSPEEILVDPDVSVVAICTPSDSHGALTLAALRAGKHVVVEKPMTLDAGEAEEIVAEAAARNLVVSPVSQRRFEPVHQKIKSMLDNGDLGRLILAESFLHWWRDDAYYASAPWRVHQELGGGSLMNQGVHNIDLLEWLVGPSRSVQAMYATLGHDMPTEDTTVANVELAGPDGSGALGVIITSTATYPGEPAELILRTSKGTVRIDQEGIADWSIDGVDRPEVAKGPPSGASDPSAIGYTSHAAQWRDVLAAIDGGTAPLLDAESGWRTVQLMTAMYDSAETGQRITLKEHP